MGGGPTVNLVIAFLIFAGVFATYGNPGDRTVETTIAEVNACVIPGYQKDRVCTPEEVATRPTPAYAAGIEAGDRIVSFNGTPVTSWTQVQSLVKANGTAEADVVVERDGKQLTFTTETAVRPPDKKGRRPTTRSASSASCPARTPPPAA